MDRPDPVLPTLETIRSNLDGVIQQIGRAAARGGRDPSSVVLVAITKGFPVGVIRLAHQAGLRVIGENRVEEAEPKQARLADLADLRWHMVGHIQSRKAKRVAPAFDLVHSVDRLKLARLLDHHAGQLGRRLPVLLECNLSGEPSKAGWDLQSPECWSAALAEFSQIRQMPCLEVLGLMTMAPMVSDPEQVRPIFRRMRELQGYLSQQTGWEWPHLSMGMSDDFQVAVEEGATMVRIGRALFGPRPSVP